MIGPLVVLAGVALQLPPCVNPLLMAAPSPEYMSLIARYRGGDREGAVSELIPSARFLGEIAALAELLGYHTRHRSCPVREDLEAVTRDTAATLRAAVLLHTDRALRLFDRNDGGAPAEMQAAMQVLALMDEASRRALEPRWARATGLELSRHGRWDRALAVLDPVADRYADDPLLLLARGAALESRWRVDHQLTIDVQRARFGSRRTRPRGGRELLEGAEKDYRQALAVRKDLSHARVRLGRVLQLLDRLDESVRELQAVTAADRALLDSRDVYLAHLFLGSAHERAGSMDRAAAEYERAVGALPDGQAAAVALSHALHRDGRWRASQEALQSGVARAGRREVLDPWWPYVAGQAEDPAALFEELHAEVGR